MALKVCSASLALNRTSTGCIQHQVPVDIRLHHSESKRLSPLPELYCPLAPTSLYSLSATTSHKQRSCILTAATVSAGFESNSHSKDVVSPGRFTKLEALSTESVHPSCPVVEVEEDDLNLVLGLAMSEEKLRSAATLRARSFYTYPEGRSVTARKMHQMMKAEDEMAVLKRKIGGLEQGYKRTTCVIASCPSSDVPDSGTDLHDSCMVTGPRAESYVLVGTLDLNQGLSLPGEVMGEYPTGPEAEHRRAYLSNVCVAEEVRRRGVGMELVDYAKETAKLWGISDLYVHVVVDNISARKLYEKAGFLYEKEESVKEARSLGRPQRYLLRVQLI